MNIEDTSIDIIYSTSIDTSRTEPDYNRAHVIYGDTMKIAINGYGFNGKHGPSFVSYATEFLDADSVVDMAGLSIDISEAIVSVIALEVLHRVKNNEDSN